MQSEKSCFPPEAALSPPLPPDALQVLFAPMKVEDLCVNPEAPPNLSPPVIKHALNEDLSPPSRRGGLGLGNHSPLSRGKANEPLV